MANRVPGKVYINPNSDFIVRAKGLFYLDPTESAETKHYFDNSAVATVTLYDQYSNPVQGCIGKAILYVSGTQGNFAGVVPKFSPAIGTGYTLLIAVSQGVGKEAEFNIDVEVTLRTS